MNKLFAIALAGIALASCKTDDPTPPVTDDEPAVPVITITTQPTAPADLTEGLIPADTRLTVEASVTEGAMLTYQWYTNTTASNEGGTAIDGETGASFTIPTGLLQGTYYYFCEAGAEGAESVRTNAVTVSIALVPLNGRITWKDSKYVLTTDPTDAGLYFRFGSVAGIFSGNGVVQTLPEYANDDPFDTGDIAWSPVDITDWASVPVYGDYNANIDDTYHTIANVKAGKGDPCRLVGLDLAKIKSTATASLSKTDIDNGLWRLPTNDEQKSFTGYENSGTYTAHWTTLNNVPGGMFPDATAGSAASFLPAAGCRTGNGSTVYGQGSYAYYWSNMPSSASSGYALNFFGNTVTPEKTGISINYGSSVRCVRQ